METKTLSVLVENRPGVLARISGLFARRGFNIDSLAVGKTEDPDVSRMTIVVRADGALVEQISKQLHKLINVLRISELTDSDSVERELALIKVGVGAGERAEVLEVVQIFRAKVVDVEPSSIVVEATGTSHKVGALEEALRPYEIVEMARTGRVSLGRGPRSLKPPGFRAVAVASHMESTQEGAAS